MKSALYIHLPFCRSKCAYCDFFSTPSAAGQMARYVDALLAEWRLRSAELDGRQVATIYLGGGTPSLLPDSQLERLIAGLGIDPATLREFTIEANPEDISAERLARWQAMGFNRVSIGVQSFSDDFLAAIGRSHRAADSRRALEILSRSGINCSADLIYGLPGQTPDQWERELDEMLRYGLPHLSAYLLSYEPGTRLYARLISGKLDETDEETAAAMYRALCERTSAAGLEHYEISNFARPGACAIHNSSYWNDTPYLGLGAAAHSFTGGVRRYNPSALKRYMEPLLAASQSAPTIVEEETAENRLNDYIITALRTAEGFDREYAARRFPARLLNDFLAKAKALPHSAVQITPGRVAIPEPSWLTADAILRELIV